MQKANMGGRRERKRRPEAVGLTHPRLKHPRFKVSQNHHLHLALAGALVGSFLIAVAVPIARTEARLDAPPGATMRGEGGVTSAVEVQMERVAGMLASAGGGTGSGPRAETALGDNVFFPRSLMEAARRIATRGVLGSTESVDVLSAKLTTPVWFTVHDEGYATSYLSGEATVGGALAGSGIVVGSNDLVAPKLGSVLSPGSHVYVQRALGVQLVVGGVKEAVFTHADTVGGLLGEAGVRLEESDRVAPTMNEVVQVGMTVTVTTIRQVVEVEEEIIEFGTVYRYDDGFPDGEWVLVKAGSSGMIRREYAVRVVDGRVVKRELIREVRSAASDEVVTIGTYVAPTPVPVVVGAPGDLVCRSTMNVYATWYTAASAGGSGTTATGTGVYKGIVAVDPRVIPLGTRMYIPGYGYGLAADTGGGIKGDIIDLGYGPNDVYDWRSRRVDICIL